MSEQLLEVAQTATPKPADRNVRTNNWLELANETLRQFGLGKLSPNEQPSHIQAAALMLYNTNVAAYLFSNGATGMNQFCEMVNYGRTRWLEWQRPQEISQPGQKLARAVYAAYRKP